VDTAAAAAAAAAALTHVADVVAFTLGRTARRVSSGALSKWMGGGRGAQAASPGRACACVA